MRLGSIHSIERALREDGRMVAAQLLYLLSGEGQLQIEKPTAYALMLIRFTMIRDHGQSE